MDRFIKYLNAYSKLSDLTIEKLRANIITLELQKNQLLLRQDQICKHLYFVEKGILKQYYFLGDKAIIDYFATENKIVSSISSLFGQKPSNKIIEAIETSTLQAVSYEKLESLFLDNPDLERVGRLIATEAFMLMEERIFSLQFHTAKKRYDDLLNNNPDILMRVSLGDVASYLGITQVTLSRIRSQK
ncbi:Crp/Fnr family transcriptional regulator [Parasediminibacterium paludis]|uniref:Crp/Fnr family transcriptional regulator n=1 Tax=Parasediminibacterium paludis TaxID=908966 RepID=A0ABV8PWY8_9BACT